MKLRRRGLREAVFLTSLVGRLEDVEADANDEFEITTLRRLHRLFISTFGALTQ